MSLPPDLIVIGDLLVDVVAERPSEAVAGVPHGTVCLHPAGSAANAAAWASAAGATVSVVGAVGDDLVGHVLKTALSARGVDVSRVRVVSAPTGALVLMADAPAPTVASRGANSLLDVVDLPAALLCGAVLVSGYTVADPATEAVAREAIARARAPHVAVHAAPFTSIARRGTGWFFAATKGATMLLANEAEAEALTGVRGDSAARALATRYRVAAVTLGAGGAVVASAEGVETVAAPSITELDAMGAGDAFAGVFLASLTRGGTLQEAATLACRAGARCAAQRERWPAPTAAPTRIKQ